MGIDLMIFCLRDSDIKASEMDIEIPLESCELRLFTFYNIDYISIDRENPNYTTIGSSGDDFTCNERYEVVKQRIKDLNNFRFN